MSNIVLFGSTGMLGAYIKKVMENAGHTVKCVTKKDVDIANCSFEDIEKHLYYYCLDRGESKENIIINCAGLIPQRTGVSTIDMIKVNAEFPHNLEEFIKRYPEINIKLIHISTNCVFGGKHLGEYKEYSPQDATDAYGKSKSLGEPVESCVIRTSIIGEEIHNKKSLLEWAISQKGKEVYGFHELWNGVTCLFLAQQIESIIEHKAYWKGVRHIFTTQQQQLGNGSFKLIPDLISKRNLLFLFNEVYDLGLSIKSAGDSTHSKLLGSDYPLIYTSSFKDQLIEQKNFNIYE